MCRILIVEDQLDNQLLLTQLMESIGIQVRVAKDGQQGVHLFQSWQPHLIWMDRRMPMMDGMDATKIIRQLPGGKNVKIIAVTASAFMEQRQEMLQAGMDDFVRKPYRAHEIYDCLAKHLGLQYLYEGAANVDEAIEDLTPGSLSHLPQDLCDELREALQRLESERIAELIEQVAAYDKSLQLTLTRLAYNFDYPAILKALD